MIRYELVGLCHISELSVDAEGREVRRSIFPGRFVNEVWEDSDISGETQELQDFAVSIWTIDAVEDFKSSTVGAGAFIGPVSLVQVFGTRLSVNQNDWFVDGVERSSGIVGADLIDTDIVWVWFSEPQPDTNYVVIPADGVTKYTDFVEVSRPGLTEISIIGQRVQ